MRGKLRDASARAGRRTREGCHEPQPGLGPDPLDRQRQRHRGADARGSSSTSSTARTAVRRSTRSASCCRPCARRPPWKACRMPRCRNSGHALMGGPAALRRRRRQETPRRRRAGLYALAGRRRGGAGAAAGGCCRSQLLKQRGKARRAVITVRSVRRLRRTTAGVVRAVSRARRCRWRICRHCWNGRTCASSTGPVPKACSRWHWPTAAMTPRRPSHWCARTRRRVSPNPSAADRCRSAPPLTLRRAGRGGAARGLRPTNRAR